MKIAQGTILLKFIFIFHLKTHGSLSHSDGRGRASSSSVRAGDLPEEDTKEDLSMCWLFGDNPRIGKGGC